MNVLIIDDIKLIGNSIKSELSINNIWKNIFFYHYDVENRFEDNVKQIASLIIKNKIDVLCLDRGYSKIYEDDENYIYSSIEEKHRGSKVKGEEVLLGKNDSEGLLDKLIKYEINLKSILLYTYDKGNNEIDILIECIKETINQKLNSLKINADFYCFETSSIFNKPLDTKLYPDSFYISSIYKQKFIDFVNKKRNIGTKSAYVEYGQLIASIINDVVLISNRTIYSYFNDLNIKYDSFLRSINNLHINNRELRHEYYTDSAGKAQTQVVQKKHVFSKFNLSSVSVLFNINGQEKYLVDIPFKKYYSELNDNILKDGLQALFKNNEGGYLKNQYVMYCYNFFNNKEFHLYEFHTSTEIKSKTEIIKKWLPILHSGAFHSTEAWKCNNIIDCSSQNDDSDRITLLFYFDNLEVFGYDGHINFTFYQEDKFNTEQIKKEVEGINKYKVPLLKAKASEVLIPELKKEIEKQATRAAISQDQARAGSHNIGSHVLNRLISNLFNYRFSKCYQSNYNVVDVVKLFDIQELLNTFKPDNNITDCDYNSQVESLNQKFKLQLTKLVDLVEVNKIVKVANFEHIQNQHYKSLLIHQSNLNNYIKNRMEYLSDVSFGIPAMQITKRFKSEVLKELDEVRLLLENISGLSHFKYSINLLCDFDEDPAVAMPNDILGSQAFYNIVENVIRNTAKHGNKDNIDKTEGKQTDDGEVKFTIEIKKIDEYVLSEGLRAAADLLYEVQIYDNILIKGANVDLEEVEKNEFKQKNRSDAPNTMSKIDYLVYKQNSRLNESILKKDDNTLRSTSLGLIEMEASACYLRKMDISLLEDDDYQIEYDENICNSKVKLNILKAIKVKAKKNRDNAENGETTANENEYYFGYRFFVLKPAEVLLVGDYQISNELKNNGFLHFTYDDFKKQMEAGKVFNHQFLIYDDKVNIEEIKGNNAQLQFSCNNADETKNEQTAFNAYKSFLPKRIMKNFNLYLNATTQENIEAVMKKVWAKWGISFYHISCDNEISTGVPPNEGSKKFHILNHGPSTLSNEDQDCLKKWFENQKRNTNYIEALSSKGQNKLPFFDKFSKKDDGSTSSDSPFQIYLKKAMVIKESPQLFYPIAESAKTKYLVLDERVQYAAFDANRKYEGYYLNDHFRQCNITIPCYNDLNLGADDLEPKTNSFFKKINEFIEINKNEFSYILIHYSLLERLFNNCQDKIVAVNNKLKELSKCAKIVVTSGRGIPPDLPPEVSFVSLSPVLAALIEFKSKYYFHQIIMSSRKSNKI